MPRAKKKTAPANGPITDAQLRATQRDKLFAALANRGDKPISQLANELNVDRKKLYNLENQRKMKLRKPKAAEPTPQPARSTEPVLAGPVALGPHTSGTVASIAREQAETRVRELDRLARENRRLRGLLQTALSDLGISVRADFSAAAE